MNIEITTHMNGSWGVINEVIMNLLKYSVTHYNIFIFSITGSEDKSYILNEVYKKANYLEIGITLPIRRLNKTYSLFIEVTRLYFGQVFIYCFTTSYLILVIFRWNLCYAAADDLMHIHRGCGHSGNALWEEISVSNAKLNRKVEKVWIDDFFSIQRRRKRIHLKKKSINWHYKWVNHSNPMKYLATNG